MLVKCEDETKIKRIKNKMHSNLVAWFTWQDSPKQTQYKQELKASLRKDLPSETVTLKKYPGWTSDPKSHHEIS